MSKKDIVRRKKGEVIYEAQVDEELNNTTKSKIILGIIVIVIVLFVTIFM